MAENTSTPNKNQNQNQQQNEKQKQQQASQTDQKRDLDGKPIILGDKTDTQKPILPTAEKKLSV